MEKETKTLKIALVHDWLTGFAGGEQVLLALSELYPEAPIFVTVYNAEKVPQFNGKIIKTSFIQKLPYGAKKYKAYFPLMPVAVEGHDLSGFDIVISSSHNAAKGIITKPETLHICYCHTPIRYLWSHYHEYLKSSPFGFFTNKLIPHLSSYLRVWDYNASLRVDYFIANSRNTANRIRKYYKKEAEVIWPPVDVEKFKVAEKSSDDFYLVVGRLIAYKRADLIIEAFKKLNKKLVIIGTGEEEKRLKKLASGNEKIVFAGRASDKELIYCYQNCRAFVFAAEEDAGLVPLEAMACGKPVVALSKGGAREVILDEKTGILFHEQTKNAIIEAVLKSENTKFDKNEIRKHAEQFGKEEFRKRVREFVEEKHNEYFKK